MTEDQLAVMADHMNRDHADASVAYARHFGGVEDAVSARIAAMDVLGLDLDVETSSGSRAVRVPFDHEIVDSNDGRLTLVAMLRVATTGPEAS